jgi:hypothetical protein
MATTHKWGALGSKTTVLSSSQLNNVAHAAQKISSAISNDTDLYIFADFRLRLSASTSNRCVGPYASLYILYDLGDSTYTFGGSSINPPANTWVGNFLFDSGATTARVNMVTGIQIQPENFKVMLENNTGRPFSSCTVLEYRRYYIQST